ncbi:MAG: hypothetical protein QOJ84_1744 [Bradyrhizobium sp.]|jgi:hypothetical protein|nr:hypothetical protein [Bradyrhizobium sp.]
MAHTVKDWRIALIETHPKLFHPTQAHPERVNGYPACLDGWRDLLERASARIEAALADGGGTFTARQIKEKFGTLRFYWGGKVPPEVRLRIDEAIALAEARSACTCEECGEEGRLYLHDGVYRTRCPAHARGRPVAAEPGRENVHVLRVATPDGFRRVPRRYDRTTDSFVDVGNASPGNEEE